MPKPTSSIPTPDPQIISPDSDLAVDFFLEENKGKIIAVIVLALLGLGGWIFYQYNQGQKRVAESAAFYAAKTPEDWKAIIAKYPGSVISGNAQLLLADKLRDENKLEDALVVLSDFAKTNTTHPLIAQGWLSYGATLELKGAPGDSEKAIQAYNTVATQYSTTEAAPAALIAQARLIKKGGDNKKAREIYENIVQRFPTSLWSQEAQQEIGKLPE